MSDGQNKPVEIPQSDRHIAMPIPEGGFDVKHIETYMRMGYRPWGTIPLSVDKPNPDLLIVGENQFRAVPHLILDREVNTIPLSLLAHHVLLAKAEKRGLEHIAQTFFGMSLSALAEARADAERQFNGRR